MKNSEESSYGKKKSNNNKKKYKLITLFTQNFSTFISFRNIFSSLKHLLTPDRTLKCALKTMKWLRVLNQCHWWVHTYHVLVSETKAPTFLFLAGRGNGCLWKSPWLPMFADVLRVISKALDLDMMQCSFSQNAPTMSSFFFFFSSNVGQFLEASNFPI